MNLKDILTNPYEGKVVVSDVGDVYQYKGGRWRLKVRYQQIGELATEIPADYNLPFPTGTTIDGQVLWGMRLNVGSLPNNRGEKIIDLPQSVLSIWKRDSAVIDNTLSKAYHANAGLTWPVNTVISDSNGELSLISVILFSDYMSVSVEGNDQQANGNWNQYAMEVVLKYLRVDDE